MASIEKRGNAYVIRVSCGINNLGKRIIKTKTFHPQKGLTEKQAFKEAQMEAIDFEDQCKKGLCEPGSVTFEALSNEWVTNDESLRLKQSSLHALLCAQKNVNSYFGNQKIDKITARAIQMYVSDLARGDLKGDKKPLSVKTIKNYFWYISGVMKYAVRTGFIQTNPCTNVMIPRQKRNNKKYYSIEDVKLILKELEKETITYRTFFYLDIYSGLRRGELLGLRWEDIDFERDTVSVNRTMLHLSYVGTIFQSTKTESSERTVKIPHKVTERLEELKKWQLKQEQTLGDLWNRTNSVFTNDYGECLGYNTPYNWLKRFCRRNKIEFKAIHVFRHFVASCLIQHGIDVQSVSGVLGHSSTATTLSTYSHAFAEARNIASDVMNRALGQIE